MTSTRPDKQAVITVGEVTGINTIRFKLGTTELEVKGKVEAVIQVYDADGRVSTIPFRYEVLNDPTTDYIPSDNEQTLIEQVLGDGPRILADAQQATTDAYEAAEAANAAADNANQVASDVAQAIAETRQATQDAIEITEIVTQAEQEREVAESERQQNEDDRILAETARVQAETSRQEAEAVRQQQEAQRQSDTQTAISNAEEATEGAQAVVDNTRYIEPYNEATEYKKNNVVRHGKNAYIALQDTQGNEPNATGDSEYWGLLAVGGVDGTVSSVNGKQGPNIVLTAEDVGAATLQDLQIMNDYYTSLLGTPNGIALLNAQGKPVDSDGNEIGGGGFTIIPIGNQNLDTVLETGLYATMTHLNGHSVGAPSLLEVYRLSDNHIVQKYLGATAEEYAVRSAYIDSDGTPYWDEWYETINRDIKASDVHMSNGISMETAYNDLKSSASSVKNGIANVIGEPLLPSDTGQQMVDKILSLKNSFISALMDKGVYDANINNSLEELIMLIRNIESGNVKYENVYVRSNDYDVGIFEYAGNTNVVSLPYVEFNAPSFNPAVIVLKSQSLSTSNDIAVTTFQDQGDYFYSRTVKATSFNGTTKSSATYNLKVNVGDAIVSPYNPIIRLPVLREGYDYECEIFGFTGF
ncbi:cell envelope integrity protein TolA [Robertmurraya sp. DFI.2.37]|uniref:cell envelope integrity protein TolA n=1 Tax=Robertmurraya sp. DFI.2.37 TaxID=3031819 RepID=UPI001249285F|nr:cell envelope integrity protein TolA [Robertmurraya sp. DFI.2.37]MDF1510831.1 cell envelope integrity protein TolA [Robertmurraya sp. DFI.2.37]